jgi:hypothetical protein
MHLRVRGTQISLALQPIRKNRNQVQRYEIKTVARNGVGMLVTLLTSILRLIRMLKVVFATLVLFACLSVTAQAQLTEPALSSAETVVVKRQLAILHSSADRSMANGWSNAKKVAEMICRPAAIPALKKQIEGVDRVFLGSDDPKTLTLVSDAKLTGSGSARYPKGWQDFNFTCEIDPATAKVTSFEAVLTPPSK